MHRRPSNASVWVPCPGAPTLWEGLPPSDSDVAREGTAAHWLAEQILTGQHVGEELIDRQSPNGVFINEKMLDYVMGYVEFIRRKLPNANIEHAVNLDTIEPGQCGTIDADGVRETCITIADLKYGWRIVEPFENWQLIDYAAGLPIPPNITLFELIIYQPRAHHPEGPIRRWIVSVEDLQNIYWPKMREATKGGDCITGNWCQDCDGKLRCGALRVAGASASQYVASPIIENYDGQQLATELKMLDAAKTYLEAREDAIRTMATDRAFAVSGSVPGWVIDRAAGRRYWRHPEDLTTLETITGKTLHKSVALTPNQAEDAGLSAKLVNQYAGRSPGKVSLVQHNPTTILRRLNK